MASRWRLAVGLAALLLILSHTKSSAGMGKSPTGAGHFYGSLAGGYVHSDGPETAGHGANLIDRFFEVDDGGFVSGSLGFVLDMPGSGALSGIANTRIEAGFRAYLFDDDRSTDTNSAITDLDGTAGTSGPEPATTRQKRDVHEVYVALKTDIDLDQSASATLGLELFFRDSDDETVSSRPAITRTADIDASFYGVMFVVQPEVPLIEGLSLVGDFGAGFYHVDADGDFSSSFGIPSTISNGADRYGFRGRAVGGLKFAIASNVQMTLFGGIEYWSDVPYANMPTSFGTNFDSHVSFDDLFEVTVGVNVTIAFDGPGD